ncbi:MAG: hypothetical protein HKN68_11420 [Saprospiraceae bacterium]|nr:hypothetical protein [Saprospiraceae bacterium]
MKKQFFKRFLLLAAFIAIVSQEMFSQNWVEMMQDPDAQFEETVAAFEKWWGNRDVKNTKGTGYKQFQRWRHFMESRVSEDGRQSGQLRTLVEFHDYYRGKNLNNRSSAVTAQWSEVGPVNLPFNGTGQPNGVGRVSAIAFHPTETNTILVGSPAGGFIESNDYGNTWTNKSNALTRLGVSSIVVHPTNTNTIFIGTGDRDGGDAPGRGVWRSTDGGDNWHQWNSGMGNRTVYEILMHPGNPDIMIASANGRIYRTIDGGANWTATYSGVENFKDIAFKPGDPNIIYASSNDYFRSTDNGSSWTQITSGVPTGSSRIAIAVSPDNPEYVYLFAGTNSSFKGLYRSTNSGFSFTQRSNSPNILGYDTNGGSGSQAWYDLVALGDPNDVNHIIVGAINLWESFDGGTTWSIVSHWVGSGGNPAVHAD